jgi:hypothetical protein
MINNGKELVTLIDKLLAPNGYIRKKDTWYLNTSECICFFHLAKSPFRGYYEHVIGAFLKEIMEVPSDFPSFNKSHLKYAAGDIIDEKLVEESFDLENRNTGMDREIKIEKIITDVVIPFVIDVSSKESIKNALKKYPELIYQTKVQLREHLKITV